MHGKIVEAGRRELLDGCSPTTLPKSASPLPSRTNSSKFQRKIILIQSRESVRQSPFGVFSPFRPTEQARAQLLHASEIQFQRADESAYSIDSFVPSRISVARSKGDGYASDQSQDTIEYRHLRFEKRLFKSKVYMRSAKNVMIKELSKHKTGFKRTDIAKNTEITVLGVDASRNELSVEATRYKLETDSFLGTRYNRDLIEWSRSRLLEEKSRFQTNMLLAACRNCDSDQVHEQAQHGLLNVPFKEAKYRGLKPIHVAAMHGHITIVKTLLGCGCTIKEEDDLRRRPLHTAAKFGQAAMVKFLIKEGAQIDARAHDESQPIHEASDSGSIDALSSLIEAGAGVNCSDKYGYQPLHCNTRIPDRSLIIKYLLGKGAEMEAMTSDGSRPMYFASTSDPTNLETLIALGARVYYADGSESALQTALTAGRYWAAEILLKHGANPNHQNEWGEKWRTGRFMPYSAHLYQILIVPYSINICQILIENGANVNLPDNSGNRPLHLLANYPGRSVELVKLVLGNGAEIDAMNKAGLSALYLAIRSNKRQLSGLLLSMGARIPIRRDRIRAEVEDETTTDSQTQSHTVGVWQNMRQKSSYHNSKLSIDEHGDITESSMERAIVNLRGWYEFS